MIINNEVRKKLKEDTLNRQNGKCAICKRPSFCAACYKGVVHIDHKWQEVNTLDHNHSHENCNGCDLCIRGITHNLCNRAITIIEANLHLQNEFTTEYLNRGKQIPIKIINKIEDNNDTSNDKVDIKEIK